MEQQLTDIATIFQVITTLLLIGVLWVSILTYKHSKQISSPHIVVLFEIDLDLPGCFDLIIKNIGKSTAYQIKFSVEPEDTQVPFNGKPVNLKELSMLEELSYMTPETKIETSIGQVFDEDWNKFVSKNFEIKVEYKDQYNKSYNNTYKINLPYMKDIVWNRKPEYLERIAKALEEISKTKQKLRTDHSHKEQKFTPEQQATILANFKKES